MNFRTLLWLSLGMTLGALAIHWSAEHSDAVPMPADTSEASNRPIAWGITLGRAEEVSAAQARPILLYFRGEGSEPCRRMETVTFPEPAVRAYVNEFFVPVRLDPAEAPEAWARFEAESVPASLVLSPEGDVVSAREGYVDPGEYLDWLEASRHARPKPASGP